MEAKDRRDVRTLWSRFYSAPVHGLNLVVVSPLVEVCAGLQELVATEVVQNPVAAQTAIAEEATSAQKTQATLGLAAQGYSS